VKVFSTAENGAQTLLRVAGAEEFLGESSLIPTDGGLRESAVVVDAVQAMSWSCDEVQERIEREPKLALALAQYFGRNNGVLRERITTIANYKTGPRVVLALIQLSQSVGTQTPNGALRITGLTHQAIADYVGTSREIVTSEMNRLRRMGYIAYSRLYTDVFATALQEWMRQQGALLYTGSGNAVQAAG
jgi:CRP-like cAMP-binding protein